MDDITGQTSENTDNKEEVIQQDPAEETEHQDNSEYQDDHTAVPEQTAPAGIKEDNKKEKRSGKLLKDK